MNKLATIPSINLTTHGEDVRVSTLEIAKHTKLSHRVIIRLVRKYQAEFEELETLNFESSKSGGLPTIHALLTEQHAMFLYTLFRNITPEIVRFKLNLTKRFYQLKKLLLDRKNAEWVQYRQSGKIVTKSMNELFTKALDYCGKDHKDYRYINLQQAIYKAALGKTAQTLRKERSIPKHGIIRDHLSPVELQRVSMIQSLAEMSLANIAEPTDQVIMAAVTNAGNVLRVAANSFIPVMAA